MKHTCIPGKATRTYCLKCNKTGKITDFVTPMLHMECPDCGSAWRTISAICTKCGRPNGSPYISECPYCSTKNKSIPEGW